MLLALLTIMAFGVKQKKLFGPAPKRRPSGFGKTKWVPGVHSKNRHILYVIVAAIIFAAIYFLASGWNGVYSISQNNTITIGLNKSIVIRSGASGQSFAVGFLGTSDNVSTFFMGRTPILANPVYKILLSPQQVVNFSTSSTTTADLQIKLVSVTVSGAVVEFVHVPSTFGLRASHFELFNQTASPSPQTTTFTTTVTQAQKTTAATTTVQQSSGFSSSDAMLAVNESEYGILMNNLRALYLKDTQCTSAVYNSTFYQRYGSSPSGPNAYSSVRDTTPHDISTSVVQVRGPAFVVTFNAVSYSSITNGPILRLGVNASAGTITNATFEGMFQGSTFTEVNQTYHSQDSVTNYCGAYVP